MSEREYANIIESYKKTVEQDIRLIDKLKQQRDDLLAACEKLVEDRKMFEEYEGITACQCMAKATDDITDPIPCSYCQAIAAIAKCDS